MVHWEQKGLLMGGGRGSLSIQNPCFALSPTTTRKHVCSGLIPDSETTHATDIGVLVAPVLYTTVAHYNRPSGRNCALGERFHSW